VRSISLERNVLVPTQSVETRVFQLSNGMNSVLLTRIPILLYPHSMNNSNHAAQIGRVLSQERANALDLVFGHLWPDDRHRQIGEALAHGVSSDLGPCEGLIGAWRNGRLVGAVFSQIAPGKTADVWLPRLVADEPESTAGRLYAAMWELLTRRRVVLAQVQLSTVSQVEVARLRRGGFRHLANLLYLVSLVDHQDLPDGWGEHSCLPRAGKNACRTFDATCVLHFEPYRAARHDQWAQVLDATCERTLDCPDLEDGRNAEDAMAGYRSIGVFDPSRWLIARHQQRAVGCLLVADHPAQDNMELLYLGLIPAVRGRGWGRQLARRAQGIARMAGRRSLVLAVDAANGPALQTYTAVGFQTWQQRRLYVRQLPPIDNWHASSEQFFHDDHRRGAKNSAAAPMST
jgi:mycothiol synthase